jgi:hypothetical protein
LKQNRKRLPVEINTLYDAVSKRCTDNGKELSREHFIYAMTLFHLRGDLTIGIDGDVTVN